MKPSAIAILILVVFTNTALWWTVNEPTEPGESDYPLTGVSVNPFQRHQDPFSDYLVSAAAIRSDIRKLVGKTESIRLYSSLGGVEQVPDIAHDFDIKVIGGAWIDQRKENNRKEVDALIKLVGTSPNISRVIIGNETQLHKTVPREELVGYLREARRRLRTPVSTAEPWDFWIQNPEFVSEVDYIAIHILPYWADVPIDYAVDYVLGKYKAVKEAFPYKRVVIAETGWPSDGPQRGAAEATQANQARFIREFVRRAKAERIPYNIVEAFDQPWKSQTEGRAGSHWGLMDADRVEKFPMVGPVLEDPHWHYWMVSSSTIGFFAIGMFFIRRRNLRLEGQLFSALILQAAATAATQLAREASGQYFMPADIAFWTVMVSAQALLGVIFLTDAVEIADVVGDKPLRRRFPPLARRPDEDYPMVSLHVACCKEPPEMVIATIDSLAKLDYPRFEVIVVDNNTPDESLWRPVEARCRELGERFRFYSLGSWPGFKAGALNFAREQAHPDARIIGVVDADYVVEPSWLSATVPYFADPDVGLVQAPQEHRDWEANLFQMMENDEYSGFFRIGMVQRNEDNAIIQHGTMTLVCRATMDHLGGWGEWCICEDSELGLRILNLGKKSIYIDHAFGRGLVPPTYEAYAKQRFRWAYGGMRIARHHALKLLGINTGLTWAQRYHFIKGWLPWVGDALHMLFTVLALVWSGKLLFDARYSEFPAAVFIYPALALVLLRIIGTGLTYAKRVRIGRDRTLLAMIAGGALTHTIAKAVVQGLFFPGSRPFYRTPKMASGAPLLRSIVTAREELLLAVALNGCAFGILFTRGLVNDDAVLWCVALVTQSFPYVAAVVASVLGGFVPQTKAAKTPTEAAPTLTPVPQLSVASQ